MTELIDKKLKKPPMDNDLINSWMESLGFKFPHNFDKKTNGIVEKITKATGLSEEHSMEVLKLACLEKLMKNERCPDD